MDLLLRGRQPVVLCPARNIEHIRLAAAWRTPIAEGRMLVLSSFGAPHCRPTADLAEQRNLFVSTLADTVVIAHARSGSKIDRLYTWIMASGKRVYTLDLPENADLMHHGVRGYAVPGLVDCLLGQQVPNLTDLSAGPEHLWPMALDNAPHAVNCERSGASSVTS